MAQQLALGLDGRGQLQQRILARCRVDKSGCWQWLGVPRGDGYGQVLIDGYHWGAHRLSYSLFVGPIPDPFVVDHLCLNPLCVNPKHMEIVTKRVNTLRGNGITAQEARRSHCPRGHPYDKANTYLNRGTRYCRTCRNERTRTARRSVRFPTAVAAPSDTARTLEPWFQGCGGESK